MMTFLKKAERHILTACLLMAVLLPAIPACAQTNPVKFSLVEGIGEISLGKITGITQDANGYMWFTDQDKSCITRFDGYSMRSYRYDPANPAGLGGAYPETIYTDPKGFLWIGFYGMGLDRFDPSTEKFTHYRYYPGEANSLSSDTVSVVCMDRQGKLWIGTSNGLDILDPATGNMQHLRHDAARPGSLDYNVVRGLCIDAQGTVWVGTGIAWDENKDGGLNRFDPATQSFSHYLENQKVRALFEDSRGRLWAGTSENKLYSVDKASGKTWQHDVMPMAGSPVDHITFIREDGSGQLWIGTFESGIVRYDANSHVSAHYGNGQGLVDNSGWQAYTSREGVLWFSTQSANLYRVDLSKKPYRFYPAKSAVLAFAEAEKNHLWLSTNQVLIGEQPWARTKFIGLTDAPVKNAEIHGLSQFLPAGNGDQWLLVNGKLLRLDAEKNTLQKAFDDSDYIRSMTAIDKTNLLLATASGLYTFDLTTKQKHQIPGGANDILSLFIDSDHTLWAGRFNSNGLSRTDPSGQVASLLKGSTVTCLFKDNKNNFWAGTANGAYVKKQGQDNFSLFRLKGSAIGSANIGGIIQDDSGYIWISSRSGIFQLNPERNDIRVYGLNCGINCSGLTGTIFRKQSGEILVGSKVGFYTFDPRNIAMQSPAPQIIMRELKVSGQLLVPIDSVQSVTLQHNQDIFSIGFAGIHFSNPGENIHLYKLEGYDPDWRKAGAERTAYYFNVPPGKYTFRVRVGNNEDIWAEKSLPIEILPAWWTNIYFIIFSLVLIGAILYAAVRYRFRLQLRRQLEKSTIDQQLAELQQRSSELEMQALRSQMNPHFIFNALNAINRFILEDDTSEASGYLTKFSRLIRFILQNSEQSLIPLERELQTLELYLELEALRFDYHFSYSIQTDPSLDTPSIQVPPLIIQPYAENAIWHGLMHKATHGHLEIKLHKDDNWLYCIIRDDGIGRKRAGELKSKSANQHKSMGMKITAGRMELLKKQTRYASAITINDPVKKDGSSGGTEVILKIPLKYD